MSKVLYVTANPKKEEDSFSLSVGREFINEYKEKNPNDEIIELDLYKEDIPLLDANVFNGWGKLQGGESMDKLSPNEKKQISRINELTEQFMSADKYIFVTPLWNFSLPPMMKAYVDTFVVAGKTFKYTDKGPVGLLKDKGKKGLHIQASGGVYSMGPAKEYEHSHTLLKGILGFIGIEDIRTIFIEGTAQSDPRPEKVKSEAIETAKELAHSF